jgi:NTP pyrophosphatase (non-canonical NTP hydrolase)
MGMNILDVKEEDVKKFLSQFKSKDKLDLIFEIQDYFMKKYKVKKLSLDLKEGQELVRKYVYYMIEELFEAMNLLKNRTWTKTNYDVDRSRLADEVADFLAFLIQVLVLLEFDSEKLFECFVKKMIINDFRIRSNY